MKKSISKMPPETVFEAQKISDGKWVKGQVVGAQPFVYILTHGNYDKALTKHIGNEEYHMEMRLVRVIGQTLRKVSKE